MGAADVTFEASQPDLGMTLGDLRRLVADATLCNVPDDTPISVKTTEHEHPIYRVQGRNFKILPTSCRCGGSLAWFEVVDGAHVSRGCVCHHSPIAEPKEAFEYDTLTSTTVHALAQRTPEGLISQCGIRFEERLTRESRRAVTCAACKRVYAEIGH